MPWRVEELRGYGLRATDGSLGKVVDLLFDDAHWTVRYLVVDTAWLFGRRVLITSSALGIPDDTTREIPVELTQDQVRASPDVDADRPVSRQAEAELHAHYGWAPYWAPGVAGLGVLPTAGIQPPGMPSAEAQPVPLEGDQGGDPHLRSEREVRGYQVHATDGDIGQVDDFLIGEADWVIRYIVADIGSWFSGKRVLLSPDWIRDVDWSERRIVVDISRDQVESSPKYEPGTRLDLSAEQTLYRHYGQTVYWE